MCLFKLDSGVADKTIESAQMTALSGAASFGAQFTAPSNAHVSSHPLLTTKLSLLRSAGTPSIVARSLTEYAPRVFEIFNLSYTGK